MNVQQYLSQHGRACEVLPHPATFTAQRTAQTVHVPGDLMAKTVVLEVDGSHVLAVIPATHRVDPEKIGALFGTDQISLTEEEEFSELFPDCEVGALPPFGSQYGMSTVVDEALSREQGIVIESNRIEEAIRLSFRDFIELERPVVAEISQHE